MIYIVERKTNKIIDRCDAWLEGGLESMRCTALVSGYSIIEEEITFSGDLVIWVRR